MAIVIPPSLFSGPLPLLSLSTFHPSGSLSPSRRSRLFLRAVALDPVCHSQCCQFSRSHFPSHLLHLHAASTLVGASCSPYRLASSAPVHRTGCNTGCSFSVGI